MKIDYKWTVSPQGYQPILVSFLICWLGTAFFGISILSILLLITFLLIIHFFRDPERIIPKTNGIISPADGKIITVDTVKEDEFTNIEMKRICIFLSVFDCHIARSPISSEVIETKYFEGKFKFANSSECIENERLYMHLKTEDKQDVVLILFAGFIARRIVPYVSRTSILKIGQRIGIIKFGSRIDIYVPTNYATELKAGDEVVAGESILFNKTNEKIV
ncbi:phosphatidylserine decarboxylase [Desulfobacterota bacterium]|nr:phosphatidylserine decarboxylase [Thermodesulfobacteriota bacterium]|tara:strand:- start:133 stop:792 length:660 start_codon:yes stop_codon:yes gene_type:complete